MKAVRSRLSSLFLLCFFSAGTLPAQSFVCNVQKPPTGPAFQAWMQRDYSKAFDLYSAAVKANPNDLEALAGQIRSLLREQQVGAAAELAETSFAKHPKSAALATALVQVRFRQGRLDDAGRAVLTSLALDPCRADTHYQAYRILSVESMRASAYSQLQTANRLEPDDPQIRLAWINGLPLRQRFHALDNYLAATKTLPAEKTKSLQQYAGRLHAILAAKNGGCRQVRSSPTTTTLPFQTLLNGIYDVTGLGFDIEVNQKAKARLELDTGASGILLNRGTARKAGLVPISSGSIAGIGDQKNVSGYWAYAKDLRVGKLEFRNCLVEVADERSITGIDGLIGADVFENYHVRLDFPTRKMTLSPLPPRPGESPNRKVSLNASGVGDAATASANRSGAVASQSQVRYTDRYIAPGMKNWSSFARFGDHIMLYGSLKNNAPRLFLLDSGSEMTMLSTSAAKSLSKLHGNSDLIVTGLNGQVNKVYKINKANIVFAGLRAPLRDVPVISMDRLSENLGTEVSGIVGLDAMQFLTVDIDYRDGLIHLNYNPKHGYNVWTRSR